MPDNGINTSKIDKFKRPRNMAPRTHSQYKYKAMKHKN